MMTNQLDLQRKALYELFIGKEIPFRGSPKERVNIVSSTVIGHSLPISNIILAWKL